MADDYRVKRAYDEVSAEDGKRVLVDRLWPRGVGKEAAALDLWAKDVTPSDELRRWFHAHRDEYGDFVERYGVELEGDVQRRGLAEVRSLRKEGVVTLITASKDVAHSHVPVLVKHLEEGA